MADAPRLEQSSTTAAPTVDTRTRVEALLPWSSCAKSIGDAAAAARARDIDPLLARASLARTASGLRTNGCEKSRQTAARGRPVQHRVSNADVAE
mgnify:CR=1 FL=1